MINFCTIVMTLAGQSRRVGLDHIILVVLVVLRWYRLINKDAQRHLGHSW